MMSISPTPLRRWLAGLGIAAALLAGSCSREVDVAPADPLDALSPVTRAAVLRQGLGNMFGTPDLAGLTPYGDRAFTAPLPYPELQERSWELLLIATVDPEDYLHTAVILRPTERGDHYRQYGFSPNGYLQYQVEIRKGEPVRWLVPQREDHYEAIFGRSDMTRASNTDDELWDCGPLDECVIQYPYNHIKNEDGGYNPDDTWWGDDPPPRPDSGGGSGGSGSGSPNDDSKPDGNDPKDPCAQADRMNADQAAQQRVADLKGKISGVEHGYLVDKDGNVKQVTGTAEYVPIEPEAGKAYTEIVHTHLMGDRCAISSGDIFQLYLKMYKGGHIADMDSFRFTVLIEDHAFSLQITDTKAFERFAKENELTFSEKILNAKMARYFRKNGVDIKNEAANPTKTAGELTNLFIRFFTDSNSGLSASKGAYDAGGKPRWEAQEVSNGSVTPRCK